MSSKLVSKNRSLLALIALAALVTSCSEDPAGPGDSKTPRTGSTYRFHRYSADTSGIELPGTGDTASTTMISANAQFQGQTGVHVFMQGTDTVARIRYEENGDIRYYPNWSAALKSGWITLPVESKGTSEIGLRDTVIDLGGGQTGRNSVTLSIAYLSSEQMVVGGATFDTRRIRMRIVEINPLSAEQNLTITASETVWYSPKIGYFARQESSRSQESPYGIDILPTEVRVLTTYELK